MVKTRDYVSLYETYMRQILSGEVPACHWVRKAVVRQMSDLDRWATGGLYVWSPKEGARCCKFIELLTHTKGALAGQNIRLEPWQVFCLMVSFGWRRRADQGRRFRRVYIEVPRGNGKSCLSSGVALYALLCDNEPGAEVYSFATTRDQAKIVFGDAHQMVLRNPLLQKKFGVELTKHAIMVPGTNSTFQAKSADGMTLDGLNTHFACIDELHAHRTRAVYDVVETSMGKRFNSLLWVITTAGFDTSGICYEVRKMVTLVLDGAVEDESQFGIIYSIDEDDDWRTEAAARKANPNWGVSVRPEHVMSMLKKAQELPSSANNIKTKHLNVWCSAASSWMDMPAWNSCATHLDLDDFEGKECFIGLDLASKRDITAKVRVFPQRDEDGVRRFYVFGEYYLPETAIQVSSNSQYGGWVEQGVIKTNPGGITDYGLIEQGLREDSERFLVESVAYDPFNATQLATNMEAHGMTMVEYRMTVQNFSDPMKWLEALVHDGRLVHDGNPCLAWMMSNVVAKTDAKDNVFPRKDGENNKIDGAVALIMALGMCVTEEEESDAFDAFVSDMIVI